jgi:hypothetical protein
MKKLHKLCELAALLSLTANSDALRMLADERRREALTELDQAQERLDRLRQLLALFPVSVPLQDEEVRH